MFKSPNKNTRVRLKSQEIIDRREKARHLRITRLVYRVLLAAFIAVVCYALFFSSFLQIRQVHVLGNDEISAAEISSIATAIMGEAYISRIPKNNLLILPSDVLRARIMERFKKVRGVSVEKQFPDSLNITIDERKSLLIWCSADNCFLVDESGAAYVRADFDSEDIKQNHLIRINDASAREVFLGKNVLTKEHLHFFLEVKDAIREQAGIGIEDTYTLPSSIPEEFSVRTEKGTVVKLSSQLPLGRSLANMRMFFSKKESPAHSLDELEYIDLRYEDKIFYKLLAKPEENTLQAEVVTPAPEALPVKSKKK